MKKLIGIPDEVRMRHRSKFSGVLCRKRSSAKKACQRLVRPPLSRSILHPSITFLFGSLLVAIKQFTPFVIPTRTLLLLALSCKGRQLRKGELERETRDTSNTSISNMTPLLHNTTMDCLSDDLVVLISQYVDDPSDLAAFASTCKRFHYLCNPLPIILSNPTYALRQPVFIESSEDRSILTTRDTCLPRSFCCLFVYHTPSASRAYLGRFQRTRVHCEPTGGGEARAEVHHSLAFKVGSPEEHWKIHIRGLVGDCETKGVLCSLQCSGSLLDARGWTKARDLTSDLTPRGINIDSLGKFYVSRKVDEEEKGSTFILTPTTFYMGNPIQAFSIPVIPKPLFSYAGKITVFEPSSAFDFWNQLPPPNLLQAGIEFDCTLAGGILTVQARRMNFGVSIPVLMEDNLASFDDYRYFLLHLFRRNSGRWETLLTYFAHAARAILQPDQVPRVENAKAWPTEHRDHSYEIRNNNLFINVRDGVIDANAPVILSSVHPWRLFLSYI